MSNSLAYAHLGVIGSGAWGTALSVLANRAGTRTTLFTRNESVIQSIHNTRMNEVYLPGVFLDPAIEVTSNVQDLSYCDAVLLVLPAQSLRAVVITLSDLIATDTPIVIATKGIERGSLLLMSEVLQSIMPANPQAVLMGPNFAAEAAQGLPSASVLATRHQNIAGSLSYLLNSRYFRIYQQDDPIGVQVGGALKNVLAIACGIVHGRGLGENARAALITRGLAEISRLIVAKGGKAETVLGLSGVGDVALSCMSEKSRNYAFGVTIGQGKSADQSSSSGRPLLQEGVATAESAYHLAQKLGVNMPIIAAIHEVLSGSLNVDEAVESLLSRPVQSE